VTGVLVTGVPGFPVFPVFQAPPEVPVPVRTIRDGARHRQIDRETVLVSGSLYR